MKGTYDYNRYYFVIQFYSKKLDNTYDKTSTNQYSKFGGLTVEELFKQAPLSSIGKCDGVSLLGCTILDNGYYGDEEQLAEIDINDVEFYSYTLEYALANKAMSYYPSMSDSSKRKLLSFLERYVVDYEQVRDFALTGNNILEGVDPLFGISAQGTARRKVR